jgi:hypothetical protein
MGIALLILGLLLGTLLGRWSERRLLGSELKTGEIELDGWHYWVQAVEFPPASALRWNRDPLPMTPAERN